MTHRDITRMASVSAVIVLAMIAGLIVVPRSLGAATISCPTHTHGLHVLIQQERATGISCATARQVDAAVASHPRRPPHQARVGRATWRFTYHRVHGRTTVVAKHAHQRLEFKEYTE